MDENEHDQNISLLINPIIDVLMTYLKISVESNHYHPNQGAYREMEKLLQNLSSETKRASKNDKCTFIKL